MIRLLPVYQGVDYENPYSFMRDFKDVYSCFLSTGSPLHIICMILFPFCLKEKAKIWFHSLAPNSIFTWEDMRNEYLIKFFPSAHTNTLMRAIQNFSKKPSEPFAIVWERYKDLLHALCHAPIPGPTRLADPNRFPGRETIYWDSLPDFFFKTELVPVGVWPTSYESYLQIQNCTFTITNQSTEPTCSEPLLVCWPSYMQMFSDVFFCTYTN